LLKFTFPLENALEYRVSIEEHETALLVNAMKKVQAVERALAKLNHEKQIHLSSCNNVKTNLTTMQQQEAYLTWLNLRIEEQLKKLEVAKKDAENQRNRMVEASVKRKSLELVKEKRLDEYHSVLSKDEQNMLDDVGIAAYCHRG
jgi:flagellar FliJ protein